MERSGATRTKYYLREKTIRLTIKVHGSYLQASFGKPCLRKQWRVEKDFVTVPQSEIERLIDDQ